MPLRAGERVIAARSLAVGRVPKGTPGRVVRAGFFGSYDVDFGHGRILHGLNRDALSLPPAGPWWARRQQRK